jgi:hypothetical protein
MTMARESEQPGQSAREQIRHLNSLLSDLIEEMATGDSPPTWATIMALIRQSHGVSER